MKKIENVGTENAIAYGVLTREKKMKVFDWHKAVRIIKKNNVELVSAGLAEDWFCTGGIILKNGEPVLNGYPYLASTWATPTICFGDLDSDEGIECWCWEDECDWTADSCWPASALMLWEVLNKGE